uniref:BRX domain-containing protein n=1 Tax=Aegilops tauschii subsp. strangulata TaxID=200361 RepID=A0A453FWZ5_AEGTS
MWTCGCIPGQRVLFCKEAPGVAVNQPAQMSTSLILMVWCIPGQPVLKNMVLKLSGTQRQGVPKRGGSPPPRGRTTSLYRSGYYRSGVVQDDMAVPPATYLGHGAGGGGGTAASSASSTPAWERPPNGGQGEAAVREWVAQVEPGVQITFVSLAGGAGNDLKRIRFSREMYYKWQAQRWCGDNNERIMELYNVRRFTRQVLPDPPRDDDDAEVSVTGTLCADGAIVVHRCLRLKDLFAAEGVVLLAVAGGLDDGQPSATTGAGPGGPGGAARQH